MINYSDYTLKQFCCAFDLKTASVFIAATHFIILNSILYSWDQYTGEKVFWTIVQALSTVALLVGVIRNNYLLYVPWIIVVFPSVAAIIVGLASLGLVLFVFVAPFIGFLYCFWCVFSAFDDARKSDETRLSYDEPIV
ncbi:hypothetical protein HA402_014032 [Bradysia odoriphaga]|nr:hypothetical protein HA402_014032 [Bradysia odoriphaga]